MRKSTIDMPQRSPQLRPPWSAASAPPPAPSRPILSLPREEQPRPAAEGGLVHHGLVIALDVLAESHTQIRQPPIFFVNTADTRDRRQQPAIDQYPRILIHECRQL